MHSRTAYVGWRESPQKVQRTGNSSHFSGVRCLLPPSALKHPGKISCPFPASSACQAEACLERACCCFALLANLHPPAYISSHPPGLHACHMSLCARPDTRLACSVHATSASVFSERHRASTLPSSPSMMRGLPPPFSPPLLLASEPVLDRDKEDDDAEEMGVEELVAVASLSARLGNVCTSRPRLLAWTSAGRSSE